MNQTQKEELISRIENDYGIDRLFNELGFKDVKKRGKNISCVCPFHENADNKNAFVYNLDKHFAYCFTHCHQPMDIFSIIMKAKNYDFTESIEFLSDLVNIEIDNTQYRRISSDSKYNREFLNQIRKIKNKSKKIEWKPLDRKILDDFVPKMHKKLRLEGYDDKVREYFNLGFAQTGFLENRITIPIEYIDGSLVTVSGRSPLSEDELELIGERKYKLWFNTDKSVTLYNINRALPYIEITKEVIVVEGFKSVWRLFQWDIRNTVAVMGASLCEEQRKLLLKLNCKILVCGDKDEAGRLLNKDVVEKCSKFSNVEILDMNLLDIPEKSAIHDISKEQFLYLYKHTK